MRPRGERNRARAATASGTAGPLRLEGWVAEPPTLFTTREGRPGGRFLLEVCEGSLLRRARPPRRHEVVGWDAAVAVIEGLRPGQRVVVLGREGTCCRKTWGRVRVLREILLQRIWAGGC